MRILIAPDSFKGTLTSVEAAEVMADGIERALPQAELIRMPLADAGEGTLQILQAEFGGKVEQGVLCFDDHGAAGGLIESARFIGLHHPSLPADPFARGSGPLGGALVSALNRGAEHIYITLGGSGTVDGGLGLLNALGCRA